MLMVFPRLSNPARSAASLRTQRRWLAGICGMEGREFSASIVDRKGLFLFRPAARSSIAPAEGTRVSV